MGFNKSIFIYFFIALLYFGLHFFGLNKHLSSFYFYITQPIYTYSKNFKSATDQVVRAFERSAELDDVYNENVLLKEQVQGLVVENKVLESLNEFISLYPEQDFNIGKLIFVDEKSSAVVNAFGDIKVGDVALVGLSVFGVVSEVEGQKVTVMLVSSPDFVTESITSQNTLGITKGGSNGFIELTEVLQGDTLLIGDIVSTSPQSPKFNSRYILGEVVEITDDINAPYKSARLKQIFNLGLVETVYFIKNEI